MGRNSLSGIPEELIVINSSAPYFLKNPGNTWLPILSELNLLFTLPSRMYNNEGVRQVRELREKFFASEREPGMKGVIVSIEEPPDFLAEYLKEQENQMPPLYPDEHFDAPSLESDRKERAELQQKANESFAQFEEVKADEQDYEYFEYPDRKLVALYIRKAATQVMKWLKFGGDYKEVKDRLKAEIEEKRQELGNIEENIAKLEEKHGERDYLVEQARAKHELHREKIMSALEQCELKLGNYECNKSTEQLGHFKTFSGIKHDEIYKKNQSVETTLNPLGCKVTARLLWHGYFIMMVNAKILLDYPLVESVPKISDFEKLAGGKSRFR